MDSWARTLASSFFITLEGVNALRRENRREPIDWIQGEVALGQEARDTFTTIFKLRNTEEYVCQLEGIPMKSLLEYSWQLANNPNIPIIGSRGLAASDWKILEDASKPYTDLHQDPLFNEERLNHEAFLVSTDPLRSFFLPEQNWRVADFALMTRSELRFLTPIPPPNPAT